MNGEPSPRAAFLTPHARGNLACRARLFHFSTDDSTGKEVPLQWPWAVGALPSLPHPLPVPAFIEL